MITRIIDIVISLIGLIILGLMYPLLALFIKFDSPGPVFYKCRRVGLNGAIFFMVKFRTMYETPQNNGPSVSPQGDPRVTTVGRVLRRLKLNEFPQFINLFKGDMTLVGPRPESPDLAAAYPPAAQKIFSVKPGIIGPNQIMGRNEEELYPLGADPKQFYLEQILPQKLHLDLQYIEDRTLLKNLNYLFQGLLVTITGAVSRRHLWDNRTQLLLFTGDIFCCLFSLTVAHYVRFEGFTDPLMVSAFYQILPWAVLARLPIFIYCGFYHVLIRYLSLVDLTCVLLGVSLGSVAFVAGVYPSGLAAGYSRGVFIMDWFCLSVLLTGYRALAKKLYLRFKAPPSTEAEKKKVLIWGAGDCGELCLRFLQKVQQPLYEVIGFIDDNPQKRGKKLGGVKILGDRYHLEIISQLYKVQQIYIALANAPRPELSKIQQACCASGLEPHLFSLNTEPYKQKLFPAPAEDLIPANAYTQPLLAAQK
jgi:lipopolysaccharide/colanic/teichoic acid biosynthesis glycosyltransferase